ncbi:MAG: radical SAM protein [Phycisphaerae bacterium]
MKIIYVIRDMSFVEPLGIMFLSAIARRDGHESILGVINEEDVLAKVQRQRPDMVCMSVMSVDAGVFAQLARDIKDRDADTCIVVGGPHATFEPGSARTWSVDAIVRGEGDAAFRDLIRAVDAGEPFDGIENVATVKKINPLRRLIEPLDDLPYPDRELVYFPGGHLAGLNVKSFMSSRGCAYRCTYCFNSKQNELYRGKGRPVRRFSVNRMIDEIDRVRTDYGMSFVRFGDDVFAYTVDDWLEEFAEEYARRIRLPFYCLVRPDLLKRPLVATLRRAGCHSVCLSIEAGNKEVRRLVLQRRMDDEVILEAFRNLHGVGIKVYANAMVGLPGTTIEHELQTVALMARCRPVYPSFTVFTPFRGTTLGEQCARHNLIDGVYPEHTTERSILNCFTERDKDIQVNIVHLGIFAVRFVWIKNLVLNRLLTCRPNRLFFFAWYLMKNYVSAKHIWPIRAGVRDKIRLAFRALAFELPGRVTTGCPPHHRPTIGTPRAAPNRVDATTPPWPVLASGGYASRLLDRMRGWTGRIAGIVKRPSSHRFVVLPQRRIVERTLAWLGRYRRPANHHETLTHVKQ